MNNTIYSFSDIKLLYKSGKIQDSYNALNQYLIYNTQDKQALTLLNTIKKQILAQNLKKIDEAIERVDWLWKEKKYEELLNAYLEIKKYAPDYEKLEKLIKKVYNIYSKELEKNSNDQFIRIKNIVNSNIQKGEYQQAIEFLENTIAKDPNPNPAIKKLLIEVKRSIIDKKILNNKKYLNSNNIPQIYEFLKSLYNFEPSYPKTQKMLITQHKKLDYYYKNKKIIFEKDSERQIKVLYNTKEYKKCLQACQELLRSTFYNKTAIKYKIKAEKAITNQNFIIAYNQLKTINS